MGAKSIFCKYMMATRENPAGTDCTAHLADAWVFECRYATVEHAKHGPRLDDMYPCEDFDPLPEPLPLRTKQEA